MREMFPDCVSYNRFVELQKKVTQPLAVYRKRAIIETVNDLLKNTCQIEHSRHRSFDNFIANMISGLIAYSFLPKKPSIKIPNRLPNIAIA